MKGESIRFENDPSIGQIRSYIPKKKYAISDIAWITFNNPQKGGREGFRKGALIGSTMGLAGGFVVFTGEVGWFWAIPLSMISGVIYGAGGAATGFLGGKIRGYQTIYEVDYTGP